MRVFLACALLGVAVAEVLLAHGGIAGSTACDTDWVYFQITNSCYWQGDHLNFDAAEANCVSLGGHLTSIHNAFENSFVQGLTETGEKQSYDHMTWIGLRYSSNNWKWTDGTDSTFQFWMKKRPHRTGKDDCAELMQDEHRWKKNSKGEWDNVECGSTMRKYVCKKATYS